MLVRYSKNVWHQVFLDEHKDDFDLVEWVLFDEHTKSVYRSCGAEW